MVLNTIVIDNVSLVRDGRKVLDDFSWHIGQGEKWLLMGLNGAGKSTVLNMISGYLWPTEGRIEVLGEEFGTCELAELRKRIGYVGAYMEDMVYPQDSVLEVVIGGIYAKIGFWGEISEKDRIAAMESLNLAKGLHLANRTFGQLSQGEKMRALIARAMVSGHDIVILDEPCSGLDPLAREDFLQAVDGMCEACPSMTLIMVTHHMEEITASFTHALLLKNGTVYAQGEMDTVLCDKKISGLFDRQAHIGRYENRFSLHF